MKLIWLIMDKYDYNRILFAVDDEQEAWEWYHAFENCEIKAVRLYETH